MVTLETAARIALELPEVTDGTRFGNRTVLAANTEAFFTIEHFRNYPAVLVQLTEITEKALRDAIVDGWLACAPPTLADSFMGR